MDNIVLAKSINASDVYGTWYPNGYISAWARYNTTPNPTLHTELRYAFENVYDGVVGHDKNYLGLWIRQEVDPSVTDDSGTYNFNPLNIGTYNANGDAVVYGRTPILFAPQVWFNDEVIMKKSLWMNDEVGASPDVNNIVIGDPSTDYVQYSKNGIHGTYTDERSFQLGLKTETPHAPINDNDITNKKYVDTTVKNASSIVIDDLKRETSSNALLKYIYDSLLSNNFLDPFPPLYKN
jgi:hypothetical protein